MDQATALRKASAATSTARHIGELIKAEGYYHPSEIAQAMRTSIRNLRDTLDELEAYAVQLDQAR